MKKSLPTPNRWYHFLVLLFMALFSYGQVPVAGIVTDAQEISVGSRSTLNVSPGMSENILQEVVVVGYGTQKEKELRP